MSQLELIRKDSHTFQMYIKNTYLNTSQLYLKYLNTISEKCLTINTNTFLKVFRIFSEYNLTDIINKDFYRFKS